MRIKRRRKGIAKREVTDSRDEKQKQAKGGFLACRIVQDSNLLAKRDAENGKLNGLV